MGLSRRSLTRVRALALVAALLLTAPIARADGLLYKPGDIILPLVTYVDNAAVGEVVDFDPNTLNSTPIATGDLLAAPLGAALDANGDILVVEEQYATDTTTTPARILRIDGHSGAQSLVADLPADALASNNGSIGGVPCNPARLGSSLYIRTSEGIIEVDLDTGSVSEIAKDGFLAGAGSGIFFVTAETDSTLLTFTQAGHLLIRVAVATGQLNRPGFSGDSVS